MPHVGRFEILTKIASGGMATVYLARERRADGSERDVALKLVHPHLREIPGFSTDLIEEAKLAEKIRHPNVVETYDAGSEGEDVYLAMEYVEGETLMGLLQKAEETGAPLPAPVALRVLVDALHGLHAAHELRDEKGDLVGLVHRDFSPQNILVGVDGKTRLSDFGVAKASNRLGHTATGMIKGKIRYMSPEQVRAHPLDRRCDIWAAGVIAWEVLARRKLFIGESDVAIALAVVKGQVPPLLDIDPTIPAELEAVVGQALATKPEERHATARELADALAAAAQELGGLAGEGEVGAFVEEHLRPELVRRRFKAARALASSKAPPPKRDGGRSLLLGGGAVVVAASLGVLVAIAIKQPPKPAPAAPPTPTTSRELDTPISVAPPSMNSAGAPDAPASSSVPSPELAPLELRSDAPIVRVRIGSRIIPVSPAASTVVLPLGAEERAAATHALVTAADGRSTGIALAPGATTIDVVFPRYSGSGGKGGKTESIAPNPYARPR